MGKRSKYGGGPRTLGTVLPQATDPIARRRGFQNGEILTRWAEIVGSEVAEKSSPEQLSYAQGKGIGGTLRVRVESAWALELQHLEPVIVERINTFFGHAAVSHLKLIQAPLGNDSPHERAPTPEATEAQAQAVDQVVSKVDDEDLRAVLRALGES
ncbi:MAG: DUF721 domain-containing protein, partial [Alphaproteobacteria bacterium]|nr:DUF721 domain-containing protein [Alphaproteobacteria bacterium]